MNKVNKTVHKPAAAALLTGFIFFILLALLLQEDRAAGWVAGYLVGFLATALHYVQALFSKQLQNEHFFTLYTPMSLGRMMVVLFIFVLLLIWEKFDQFSFTVSFLISYIYHSVINIYLINKTDKPNGFN